MADKAVECDAEQKRLKESAAASREKAAKSDAKPGRRAVKVTRW